MAPTTTAAADIAVPDHAHPSLLALSLGAVGVVYGDIGPGRRRLCRRCRPDRCHRHRQGQGHRPVIQAEGAEFLNDLTADKQGRVYASDMPTDTIWMLEGGKITILLHDEELNNPNGLLALDDGRILVGSWGRMAEDFSTKVPGHMRVIDMASKKVSDLGDPTRSAISMASSPMVAAATWLPIR